MLKGLILSFLGTLFFVVQVHAKTIKIDITNPEIENGIFTVEARGGIIKYVTDIENVSVYYIPGGRKSSAEIKFREHGLDSYSNGRIRVSSISIYVPTSLLKQKWEKILNDKKVFNDSSNPLPKIKKIH